LNKARNRRIKVLFFISSLDGGGAERVMVDILGLIDKERIEPVLVLLYPLDDSPYKEYLPEDVEVVVVKRKSDAVFEKIKQFVSFFKVVRGLKPEVVLSMLTHNNIMAVLAGLVLRIKVIVCEHNTLGEVLRVREGERILGFTVAPFVKTLYRFADRVIAVSEGIKDNLIEDFNISENKIEVINNPLDLDRIAGLSSLPPEHPFFYENVPVVVAIGRLVTQKGFDILLKAFSKVSVGMDARLVVLGDGPERESLLELAMDLDITDKVSFAGFRKNPYGFLSRADVFVLSSTYEGLPMVILEAMACGAPVVATACRSGPCEILKDGRYGMLVPPGDEVALSDGILRLLNYSELREKLSRSGKERAEDFSIENIIKLYERAIYEAVAG